MRPPIYTPSGAALEYSLYGLNIYNGCPHGCTYCYAAAMAKRFGSPWSGTVTMRPGLLDALNKQLAGKVWQNGGNLVHLCFTCDPYPLGYTTDGRRIDTTATRNVIKAIKSSGNHVQILTKGHTRDALRDFDLLDEHDCFGVTLSGSKSEDEPHAVNVEARTRILRKAAAAGIFTWVSCEPVFDPEWIFNAIRTMDFVHLWRIGKLNHKKSTIDWGRFGRKAETLCQKHRRGYYIKKDLRKEMEDK